MGNYRYPEGHVFYRKLSRSYPLITHGEGVYLFDETGKRYLDGSGGAIVVNIGHGRKEIFEAMTEQMGAVGYVHGTQFTTASIENYSQALAGILPADLDKIYYLSGGSEAIESAIKFARQYFLEIGQPQRWRVVARWGSYHGNTLGALSLTGRLGMRKPYLPLLIHFPHFPAPYCYRCYFHLTYPNCDLACARSLEPLIQSEGPEAISAVILEPIIGATIGAVAPPKGYLKIIREICDRYGLLLIDDEVMTGMGRTGRWFGIEHEGVSPDIMVTGKGMSSGYFPLSAMITRGSLIQAFKEGSGGFVHGHTFSHHAVACAVGLRVLDWLKKEDGPVRSREQGDYLLKRLQELTAYPFVGEVRGKGLMAAIELVQDKSTKQPFPRSAKVTERIIDRAFENGLVLYPGVGFADGVNGDMVMLGPPLCISREEIDEIINILQKTLSELEKVFL
jgi:adenosylmethionine-8-amino-7-oxononanoate aminotransferase